jgi:hypothetical protein
MSELKEYIVLFRDGTEYLVDPWGFRAMAEDYAHAEEQLLDAEPGVEILWVVETDDYNTALEDYYSNGE